MSLVMDNVCACTQTLSENLLLEMKSSYGVEYRKDDFKGEFFIDRNNSFHIRDDGSDGSNGGFALGAGTPNGGQERDDEEVWEKASYKEVVEMFKAKIWPKLRKKFQ